MSSCLRPLQLRNGNRAPCGRCPECKRRYANAWSFRLQSEFPYYDLVVFNTLTYDDVHLKSCTVSVSSNNVILTPLRRNQVRIVRKDNCEVFILPFDKYFSNRNVLSDANILRIDNPSPDEIARFFPFKHDVLSVCKDDVIKYHKRLRKSLSALNVDLKYYTCSEYGAKTHRPHYHELLFLKGSQLNSLSFNAILNIIDSSWQLGSVVASPAHDTSCVNYTAKYLRKRNYVPIGSEKNFRLISRGFGLHYLNKYLVTQDFDSPDDVKLFFNSGKPCNLPRYFRDRLFEKSEQITEQGKTRLRKYLDDKKAYAEYLQTHEYCSFFEFRKFYYADSSIELVSDSGSTSINSND